MQVIKPIFLFGVPDNCTSETITSLSERLNEKMSEYHVIVYENIRREYACDVIWPPNLQPNEH
jgi:hypothetical protein